MLRGWMDLVCDWQPTIEELQPMLAIEYGIRLKWSWESKRVAGMTKSPKGLPAL